MNVAQIREGIRMNRAEKEIVNDMLLTEEEGKYMCTSCDWTGPAESALVGAHNSETDPSEKRCPWCGGEVVPL